MEVPQPKKSLPAKSSAALEQKVELDWNVPHGQMAAKHRDGFGSSRPLRVSGAVSARATSKNRGRREPEIGKFAPAFRAVTFDGRLVDLPLFAGRKSGSRFIGMRPVRCVIFTSRRSRTDTWLCKRRE